jgi:hypothetical protein
MSELFPSELDFHKVASVALRLDRKWRDVVNGSLHAGTAEELGLPIGQGIDPADTWLSFVEQRTGWPVSRLVKAPLSHVRAYRLAD